MRHLSTTDSHAAHPLESACRPVRTAQAREAASDFLARLNPPPPESTVQNVVLLVSELVTNALRHVGTVTFMELRANRHHIQVVVEDPSPAHPQDRTPDLTGRTGGFGWPMIQRLAHDVTIARARAGTGKAITATLPR
ncbi:ATP-binding protein [Streptomyces sp. NPDC058623]|uniref:ATP-binding protein n=1 Tax=Streptomyces sp. NPDC058623 TaxID=3346563 RepID=UPI003663B21C